MRIIVDYNKESLVKCPQCESIFTLDKEINFTDSIGQIKCPCCDYKNNYRKFKNVIIPTYKELFNICE